MKFGKMTVLIVLLSLVAAGPAWSHFGMLIPSDSMVMQDDNRTITLTLSFSHPFEGMGMELAKPIGLYAGNIFQGIVKLNGKPVPFAEVEIEYYNKEKKYTAPTEYMITQTIKSDGNGVFTYATPVAGWWGFAALNGADFKLPHEGEEKDVELGAVIWVYFHEMK
jgi:uncharacterized GH25 family protein